MGTHHHRPPTNAAPDMPHRHDGDHGAHAPGARPGTRSRIEEARERMRRKGMP